LIAKTIVVSGNIANGDEEIVEMNSQQIEFLNMSKEFSEPDECSETDVLQVGLLTRSYL